jgi:hypothetical protein
MTSSPQPETGPSQVPPHDLTARLFRALFTDYDLRTLGVLHIVTPKGTPVYLSGSLGMIARQISDPSRNRRPSMIESSPVPPNA